MNALRKTFFKYISLNIAGMIGLSCYILADTYFIAQALGSNGLASLNLSLTMFSTMYGIGLMIGIGAATDFALHKAENAGVNVSLVHALVLCAIVAVAFALLVLFGIEPLCYFLGADTETFHMTQTYLTTLLTFVPFFLLSTTMQAFVRNDNNPKLAMISMLASSFANIGLDYLFMFPMSMGIFGAAFATGLSPIISLGVLLFHFVGKQHNLHLGKCKLSFRRMGTILSLGFTAFVGELASAISLFTFNLLILGIAGNIGVAAYGIVANFAMTAVCVYVGISQGIQPLASTYYGQKDTPSIRFILKYALSTGFVLSAILYIAVFVFAPNIASAFNSEQDAGLQLLAIEGLHLYFVGYFFACINIISAAFLSAIAKAGSATAIALCRSCFVLVPAAIICSRLWDMTGIWISFIATEAIVFVITFVSLRKAMKGL
ncbi:MATE family efflux transporter [Chakrabartyella piscis]|uniref:MATE family efflux transporter n=1 Tax=Chakrabartyella piscis TaxID=2918914 RepID=UPI0029587D23|nr:MATE family efflux transporter [Chakrabartyella piscis]